jgi:hypothetical protein
MSNLKKRKIIEPTFVKAVDQSSNSIKKPPSYFYKKRKIIYVDEYGREVINGSWFKGPEPEKKVIYIDMAIATFRIKYPFGQRRTKDVLLKGFRKSIWECSICNQYYGKIYKNHVRRMTNDFCTNFHTDFHYIPAGSYMYVRCHCEDMYYAFYPSVWHNMHNTCLHNDIEHTCMILLGYNENQYENWYKNRLSFFVHGFYIFFHNIDCIYCIPISIYETLLVKHLWYDVVQMDI